MIYTILAVDDNPINLDLIGKCLVDSSYRLLRASSGEQALQLARDEQPDLILLDVMMPGMDGFDVCRALQSEDTTRYIPIIFLSAKNEAQSKARGLALGAADYLTKPFNALELNARIRAHLSQRRNNVEILRKIRDLQNRFLEDDASQKEDTVTPAKQSLDSLRRSEFVRLEEYFAMGVRIQPDSEPVARSMITFLPRPEQLLYVTFHAMDRSQRSVALQLMMESFVSGYLRGTRREGLNPEQTVHLFETLLREFDPGRYGVGFTFSLGRIDLTHSLFSLFAVHQPLPLICNKEGILSEAEGAEIPLHEHYGEFVNTLQMKLNPGSVLLIVQPEPDKAWMDINSRLLSGLEWRNEEDYRNNLSLLMEGLKNKEDDRLVGVIRF